MLGILEAEHSGFSDYRTSYTDIHECIDLPIVVVI